MKILSTIITLILALALSLGLGQMALAQKPQKTDISPPPNNHLTPLTQTISITYNQNINRATVSTQTFVVQAGQTGLLTQTYDVMNGTINLRPTLPFKPGELIQVTATTGTLSVDGQGPSNPTVWQFRGRASGLNAVYIDSEQRLGNANSRDVALGDLDGDGDLDAFVAGLPISRVWINDGKGVFTGKQTFFAQMNGVALGDLDGDGDLDAFVATLYGVGSKYDEFVPNIVLLNDGGGTFIATGQLLDPTYSRDVALGDLDGDGDLDAFLVNSQSDMVLLNDGSGTFSSEQSLSSTSYSVALGDLDEDGDLDAFLNRCNISSRCVIQHWVNSGKGDYSHHSTIQNGLLASGDLDGFLALGDLDGDGGLNAFRARGDGSAFGVALGDLDGDGDLDAFLARTRPGSGLPTPNHVWLNDGSNHFILSPQRLGNASSYGVALGDLDGDGDLDAFVANKFANTVWINSSQLEIRPHSLRLKEPNRSGTFRVSLALTPMSIVTTTLSSQSDQCRFSPSTLSLDSSNWQIGRTVSVIVINDFVADGPQDCLIEINVSSDDPRFDGQEGYIIVTIEEDDVVGLQFSPLSLSEPAESGTFFLTLTSEPMDVVTLTLNSQSDECRFSPSIFSLDQSDWRIGRTVAVTAVDDLVADGPQDCLIDTSVSSSGVDYNGLMDTATVMVIDDDVAGLQFSPLSLSEPAESGIFSLTLTSEPLDTVTLTLSSQSDQCRFSPSTLSLDQSNWQIGRTVAVTTVDDLVADGPQDCLIAASVTGFKTDWAYAGLVMTATVVVADEDVAAFQFNSLRLSEPSGGGILSVTLTSEPMDVVTLTLNSQSDECRFAPSTLRLDGDTWRSGSFIVVTAIDDFVADGPQDCLIATSVLNSGADYAGLVATATVTIDDDDVADVRINPPSLSLSEPDQKGIVTLSLNSQPLGLVTAILSTQSDECQVTPNRVYLDSLSWQSGRPVTVTVVDDQVDDGPQDCVISTFVRSDAADYLSVSSSITVTVQDDERSIYLPMILKNFPEPPTPTSTPVLLPD